MKKTMVVAGLMLVVLKMVYNVYTVVYSTQNAGLEKAFNYGIIFFILYYGVVYGSKGKEISKG